MSTIVKHTFNLEELDLNPASMAKMMGYATHAPEEILEMIETELIHLKNAGGIEGGYVLLNANLEKDKHRISIEQHTFHVGKSVFYHFKESEQIAVFVCTAGEMISDRSKKLMSSGDLMEGYVVDIIGSSAVEAAMDKVSEQLKTTLIAEGQSCTNRYSPGYCGWDVAEQRKLFSFFPDAFCGVTLTDSCLMLPVKSVSGMMGVGVDVTFRQYTCNACGSPNCIYKGKK